MNAELQQDRSGLRWIRGELDQTLRDARSALEDFVDGQKERLTETVESLHHVHGALEMVQVYGGAMLADEMEQLALALLQGRVKGVEAAAEALMLGIVQLPSYLEKIEAGGADVPLVLLPLLNDLRAAHDAPLVSETSLFAPKLDAVIAAETVRPGSGNRDLPQRIHELRSHYHRGLLHWIRGEHVHHALEQIQDVLDKLNSAAGTARLRRLLDAGQALAQALREDMEAPALAVKPLFGKLDRVFKQIIDQGEEVAMLDFPVELLKNLLYYVSRSDSNDPSIVAVRQSAEFANSFVEEQAAGAMGALGGPDRELFVAVGEAVAQDLSEVKDRLDLFIRSDRGDVSRVTGLASAIQRIGDTLGMVGRGDLRSRLKHRCEELLAAEAAGQAPPDDRLMQLAGDLLFVESSLSSLASSSDAPADGDQAFEEGVYAQSLSEGEMNLHFRAAVDEALVDLSKSKDAILQYLDNPQQPAQLDDVPTRLRAVAGALRVLELPEAGDNLLQLVPFFEELAAGQRDYPDDAQRDDLADVVIGTECYIQAAVETGEDRQRVMAYAHAALDRLGLRRSDEGAMAESRPLASASEADPANVIAFPGTATADQSDVEPVTLPDEGVEFDTLLSPDAVEPPVEPPIEPPVEPPVEVAETETSTTTASETEVAETDLLTDAESGDAESDAAAFDAAEAVESETASFESPAETTSGEGLTAESVEETDEGPSFEAVDSEILEIFGEEAEEELQSIQQQYPAWRADRTDNEALTTMRRSFHTLKGSGRLVGANNIGEFAWSIENLLNRVIDGTIEDSEDVMLVMDSTLAVLPALVEEAKRMAPDGTDVTDLSAKAFALAAGESLPSVADEGSTVATETTTAEAEVSHAAEAEVPPPLIESLSPEVEAEGDAVQSEEEIAAGKVEVEPADESILTAAEVEDSVLSELDTASASSGDTSLNRVFVAEAHGHIAVLSDFLRRYEQDPPKARFDDELRRAMHTLRGCSRTAGMEAMAELSSALEDCSNVMVSLDHPVDRALYDTLARSREALSALADSAENAPSQPVEWASLRDTLRGFIDELSHPAPDLEEQHAEAAAEAEEAVETEAFDPELLEIFLEEARELVDVLETELNDWQQSTGDLQAVAQLQRTLHTMKGGARLAGVVALGDLSHALESVFESVTEGRVADSDDLKGLVRHATDVLAQEVERLEGGKVPDAHPAVVERLEAAAKGEAWEPLAAEDAVLTPDAVFAPELLPAVEGSMAAEPQPPGVAVADTEFDDEDLADSELLTDSQLMTDSELLFDSGYLPEAEPAEGTPLSGLVGEESSVVHLPSHDSPDETEGLVPRRPVPAAEESTRSPVERVRVASNALDQMVNHAGEVSIYRARIEQQNTTFTFNLGELQRTTDRLRGQLRDLELETEAQILSRHEREGEDQTDFDPLELDRYSTIQQLSRALSETVEDLSNLGNALSDLSRDTDTLLLQQARVTTDLQDSLLRTRMVKFASRVPRLERVVRQTGHGLGKHARLKVVGGHEDMDRAILERMMGPLEHLLRNAVSHGIEDTNTRLANGKPEEGTITVSLAREGSDIVLTLSDDGAGFDRDRIRAKAVERGLIDDDASVGDDELYQMILQPGFSTAEELSQVSGRGVGMDVVLTEVKQLGGSLETGSRPGKGASFTIRLPFTLAITDSLLVTLGDEIYAVPHSSMDGVVRVSVDELRGLYSGLSEVFSYADRDYQVRYLGTMLGTQAPHLPEGERWLPLLLVRSGEHRVAIQVDGLMGNRQIVVKSVGAQLSTIRWFTGGTILADGQIALILDVNSLVRHEASQPLLPVEAVAEPATKGVSIMVVDDSITVRKVTSRLLERHNMQVITARDGVDAVTQLQEYRPDVMLLDIEMPRMDGYELARHMRSTPELSDIPIIMITSRSGDKHRDRALELGVKRYLGKPYQEADLLENIYTVLADSTL